MWLKSPLRVFQQYEHDHFTGRHILEKGPVTHILLGYVSCLAEKSGGDLPAKTAPVPTTLRAGTFGEKQNVATSPAWPGLPATFTCEA